jgi:hypothetical protein
MHNYTSVFELSSYMLKCRENILALALFRLNLHSCFRRAPRVTVLPT